VFCRRSVDNLSEADSVVCQEFAVLDSNERAGFDYFPSCRVRPENHAVTVHKKKSVDSSVE